MKKSPLQTKRILTLATAGLKPDLLLDVNNQQYPRVDYLELQRFLNTEVVNYSVYPRGGIGRFLSYIETQLRSDVYLALVGLLLRRSFDIVFTMSERAGIPYSGMQKSLPGRKQFVSMFTSWSMRQERVITTLRLFSAMDNIIVKCSSLQKHFINLGAHSERIKVIPFGIDHKFFSAANENSPKEDMILAVGETRTRDYAALFEAVSGLPVKLIVAASGLWSAREKSTDLPQPIPENVEVYKKLPRRELRKLYSQARLVVLPVYDLPYSAGVTSLLEAMSMETAVIITRSNGIMDYIVDGQTGIVVEQGQASAISEAVMHLLNNPKEASRLAANARQVVEQEFNIDTYVERLASHLSSL